MSGVLFDERMSDLDALVWKVEQQPRHRTTIAALARFSAPLDHAELRHCVDRATRVIPRLRQRVIEDPLGFAAPRWAADPDFRLASHLRSEGLTDADDTTLLDRVRDLVVQPFDRTRPLWEFTHFSGLANGGDAVLLKAHHAISDGVGGVEMMLELFDFDASPPPNSRPFPPAPAPAGEKADETVLTETVLTETVLAETVLTEIRTMLDHVCLPVSLADATAASRSLGEAIGSAFRVLRPSPTARPVPPGRSDELDLRHLAVPLADLRVGGRRIGGTINDAFVSAVVLGLATHFDSGAAGQLRLSVPLNTRGDDTRVGNHWTPGRIDIDLSRIEDLDALMTQVKTCMRSVRDDPAHQLLPPVAAGLRRLPGPAIGTLFDTFSAGLDVAASNVPGSPVPLYLCGREVDAMIPFGPLSGCAVNATLLSHGDTAHIGVASDPAAVDDPDRLQRDLEHAFAVVTGS